MKRLRNFLIAAITASACLTLYTAVQAAAFDPYGGVPRAGKLEALSAPGEIWLAVTANDSADLVTVPRAIYSGDGGNIALKDKNGTTLTFVFAAGEIKPLQPVRVMATNTTSTTIYAIY